MDENENREAKVEYEIVEDADLQRYLTYDVSESDEDSHFWYDDEDEVLIGIVVAFDTYPAEDVRREIFDDMLVKAVMETQEIDEDDAREEIEELENEEDFPDLDISEKFSLYFTVKNHRGMYRMLLEDNVYWTTHSSGKRNSRWDY